MYRVSKFYAWPQHFFPPPNISTRSHEFRAVDLSQKKNNSKSLPNFLYIGNLKLRILGYCCCFACPAPFFRAPFVLVTQCQKHAEMKFLPRSSFHRKWTSILISPRKPLAFSFFFIYFLNFSHRGDRSIKVVY